MGVRLSGENGVDAWRAIRDSCPGMRVFFLSSYEDEEAVLAAVIWRSIRLSIETREPRGRLQAIHTVLQGQSILDPHYSAALGLHATAENKDDQSPRGQPFHPAAACPRARWVKGRHCGCDRSFERRGGCTSGVRDSK